MGRPAGVEGCLPISSLISLRLALAVGLAVGMYVGMAAAFRVNGYWHGSVSEGEYTRRLQEIDSPLYTHVGGMAAAETGRDGAALVPAHGSRWEPVRVRVQLRIPMASGALGILAFVVY